MRIAVNTRLLLPDKLEGFGRFACETLRRITMWHPEHEFIFIFDRKPDEQFLFSKNITPVVAYPQARHPVLWYLFFEYGVTFALNKYHADLFLSPDGWLCLKTEVPSVAVIHDLNFFHNREWVEPLPRRYYDHFFPRYIQKAIRLATVSEFSRDDISNKFGIPVERIDVVYNGVNPEFRPIPDTVKAETCKKYAEGKPYFLFVGLVHPRKNLTRIIEAYNVFRKNTETEIKLLVAGCTKYWTKDTEYAYKSSPYHNDIILMGRVPEKEMHVLVASALSLVYASLFEGFGIPILEAMRCRVPVITSNITSMPEVGGNAVYYVDPYSVQSIADGMNFIARDENLRNQLIQQGNIQIAKFSWDQTARKLWETLEKALPDLKSK
jgi:glycosyltransferase involved in cell wall biosynthesis